MELTKIEEAVEIVEEKKDRTKLRENLIYGSVVGFLGLTSTGLGFAGALTLAKQSDSQFTRKHQYNIQLHQEATRLAAKALAIGTVYAICGVTLISYGIWKLTGAKNIEDLNRKTKRIIPKGLKGHAFRVDKGPVIEWKGSFSETFKELFSASK